MATTSSVHARAAAAEADHLRIVRLRAMDKFELRRRLGGDPVQALPWIETAARYGVRAAQLRLGQMLMDGHGAESDLPRARLWFETAARGGCAEAMNMAGRCLENGWGGATDLEAAAEWYARSAEAGHDWGQYNLGHVYFDGRGRTQDRAHAMDWYRRAAEQGHARAMNLVARGYEEGWGVLRDMAHARLWYRRSAHGGYFRGQFNHATCLAAVGRRAEALEWLERARLAAPCDALESLGATLARHRDPALAAAGRRMAPGAAVTEMGR